jgi:hypothetical protein
MRIRDGDESLTPVSRFRTSGLLFRRVTIGESFRESRSIFKKRITISASTLRGLF